MATRNADFSSIIQRLSCTLPLDTNSGKKWECYVQLFGSFISDKVQKSALLASFMPTIIMKEAKLELAIKVLSCFAHIFQLVNLSQCSFSNLFRELVD